MQTFAVDSNNDLFLTNGSITLAYDVYAVENVAKNAAQAQLGEMVLNTEQGIPNFQVVWVGTPNIPQFEIALRNTLLQISNVTGISSLTTTIANNVLYYTAVILTTYGAATANGGL